ncbi:MAG TPA: hypothetical protein PK544_13710 [Spirochaetota bacterium]|nr:hypothetical protein [Spirochaetota bacterium]HPJ38627.1 hypothetical protein [Spirochaetota bacterium]HPQ52698.1 hypothetical protein [Spirochaetota bacterium]
MKRILIAAVILSLSVVSFYCKKLTIQDIGGTVWENKRIIQDHRMGTEEIRLTLTFKYDRSFSLERSERWIMKRTKLKLDPPKDVILSGVYDVADDKVKLMWSDKSVTEFTYKDDTLISPDQSRIFQRTGERVQMKY